MIKQRFTISMLVGAALLVVLLVSMVPVAKAQIINMPLSAGLLTPGDQVHEEVFHVHNFWCAFNFCAFQYVLTGRERIKTHPDSPTWWLPVGSDDQELLSAPSQPGKPVLCPVEEADHE